MAAYACALTIGPQGLFESRVLSFGLTNAPAAFQRKTNRIFGHLPFMLVYLDDILVFSKDSEQHAQHLRQVLQLLRPDNLYANMSKCAFFQPSVHFLGHVVSAQGIHVHPRKTSVIAEWGKPKNVAAPLFPWSWQLFQTLCARVRKTHCIACGPY